MVKDRSLASVLLAGCLCAFASLSAAPALASPPVILAQAYFDTFDDEPEESDEPALDEPSLNLPQLDGEIPGGEPLLIDGDVPMQLTSIGGEVRRSLVLILHDAAQPWKVPAASPWAPKGLCMKPSD